MYMSSKKILRIDCNNLKIKTKNVYGLNYKNSKL